MSNGKICVHLQGTGQSKLKQGRLGRVTRSDQNWQLLYAKRTEGPAELVRPLLQALPGKVRLAAGGGQRGWMVRG